MQMNYYSYETPIGMLTIVCTPEHLIQIDFGEQPIPNANFEKSELTDRTFAQLMEYFSGKRRTFDLPLLPKGTEFQKKVWDALQTIPYGKTQTYSEIAEQIANPRACRAVGMANNRNPIPIIIPCHRVIGKSGHLIGYGGGIEIKVFLLELESGGEDETEQN